MSWNILIILIMIIIDFNIAKELLTRKENIILGDILEHAELISHFSIPTLIFPLLVIIV